MEENNGDQKKVEDIGYICFFKDDVLDAYE